MSTLNLADIRRTFRSPGNVVLQLCDELEVQRATTADLAKRVVELADELVHYREQGLLVPRETAK